MLRWKNIAALLLGIAVPASLAVGCGSPQSSGSNPGSGPSPSTGSTEFWFDKGGDQEIVNHLTEAWQNDAGMKIQITNYPDTASYQTAIQQSIDQPDAPGLFTWWSGPQLDTLAKNGKIADLTDEWKNYIAAGVSPDIEKAFTFNGKAYAAPYSVLYNLCLYNKGIFEKAGIKENPQTFDEFLADCEKIKQSGVTPIGLKNDSWASFIWFEAITAAYDPQLYKDICTGAKPYTDPAMKEVLSVWKDMFDKGYFAKPVVYTDMFKELAKGQCAIVLEPSATISGLVKDYGMTSGKDLDAFVLPNVKEDGKSVIFFEASPICVSQNSKSKDAALTALRGFYKPATQKVMITDNGVANTNSVAVEDPTLQKIINMSADSDKCEMILRYYENTPSEIRDVALPALSKFMDGAAEIDDTLNTIQAKANEVFKK